MDLSDSKGKPWCIVVADDHGPEYVPSNAGAEKASPVQYCGFGEPTTLLQTALHRARRIAAPAQIAVTVREENRAHWESALWYLRPDRHFVSDTRLTSSLTTAAALLSIAADSAKNVVTILPARCYVANEWLLASALDRLHRMLPAIPEGVGTLGMVDIDDAVDEDYIVPREGESGGALAVMGMARRPAGWIAQHLRRHGAMVASGILTGYAGIFVAHIFKRWPALADKLARSRDAAARGEIRLCVDMYRDLPISLLRSMRWWPPIFPQRALRVFGCGWRGLHTARAVSRLSASCAVSFDSLSPYVPQSESRGGQVSRTRVCDAFDIVR
jgi:hypothetical protein